MLPFSLPEDAAHWIKTSIQARECVRKTAQSGEPGSLLQSDGIPCTSESCVCVFGIESSTFSWLSDSDKAACLLPLYVIFMDPTSRRSQGLENVQFGDIRVPPLLFFNDVIHKASTDCHFWCALEQFAAECAAVGVSSSTSKFEATALSLSPHGPHFNCGRCGCCTVCFWLWI